MGLISLRVILFWLALFAVLATSFSSKEEIGAKEETTKGGGKGDEEAGMKSLFHHHVCKWPFHKFCPGHPPRPSRDVVVGHENDAPKTTGSRGGCAEGPFRRCRHHPPNSDDKLAGDGKMATPKLDHHQGGGN